METGERERVGKAVATQAQSHHISTCASAPYFQVLTNDDVSYVDIHITVP
jgi:hypothetical protein